MAINIPIITDFDGKGIKRAQKEFEQLEGAGAKAGMTSGGYSPYLANAVTSGTFTPPATTNNVYIGTQKVDTVVSESIKRTGTFTRGR